MPRLPTTALVALAAALLAAVVHAQPAPPDPDAAEPPPILILEVDGQQRPIRPGESFDVKIDGKATTVRLSERPYRRFDKDGVRFLYPGTMRWEYDRYDKPFVLTIWTLEAKRTVMSVFRYPKQVGTPEALRGQFLDVMAPRQFGAANIESSEKATLRFGTHDLLGARLRVKQNGETTRMTYAAFATERNVFALMITNTKPAPDGSMDPETRTVLELLARTFEMPRKEEGPKVLDVGDGSGAGSGSGSAAAPAPPEDQAPRSNVPFYVGAGLASLLLLLLVRLLGHPDAPGPLGLPEGSVRWLLAGMTTLAAVGRELGGHAGDPFREATLWMCALVALAALRTGPDDDGEAPLGLPGLGAALGLASLGAVVAIGVAWSGRELIATLNDLAVVPLTLVTVFWLARAERAYVRSRRGGPRIRRWCNARALQCLLAVAIGAAATLFPPSFPAWDGVLHLVELALLSAAVYYAGAR